ncbi:hypothetical protein [Tsukamurella soli]
MLTALWDAAWKILIAGLVLGAALPALFAVGIRAYAAGDGHEHADGSVTKGNPIGKVVAYVAFAFVVVVIIFGIATIIAQGQGETLDFHYFPPFHK